MRFQVPQFIEVEDKIFGPLTIKQFIYLAGAAGLSFILFKFLYLPFAILLIIAVAGFSITMAFYRINNRPFIDILQSAFGYTFSSKLYLWKRKDKIKPSLKAPVLNANEQKTIYVPKLSDSKLHDLTWSLDIKESLNPGAHEDR